MSDAAVVEKSSFSIKAFPVEARKLALACAARAGLTMAEWMDRAVHSQARLEAGENVLPPDRGFAAPAAISQPVPGDLAGLLIMMQVAQVAAQASGKPMGKTIAQRYYGLVDDRVRAAAGLPPRTPRKAPRRRLTLEVVERVAAE
jgi:hypothetical protein